MIAKILGRLPPNLTRSWADFGCSNGFVIETILRSVRSDFDRIVGYDHCPELLTLARAKSLGRVEFSRLDICELPAPTERFKLVTCFETLEHVSDFRAAMATLWAYLDTDGFLLLTVPNETGLVGLAKLFARHLVRRDPYGAFFRTTHVHDYVRQLLTGGRIDAFRVRSARGYAVHLGFDYRTLMEHIDQTYVMRRRLTPLMVRKLALGMHVLSLFQRTDGPGSPLA